MQTQNSQTRNKNGYNFCLTVLNHPKFATVLGIDVKFQKKEIWFLSLSKMVDMIQKTWQLTKILYNSGPHFTGVHWKFLVFFSYSLNHSKLTYLACISLRIGGYWAFLGFIYEEIRNEKMSVPVNKKVLLDPDSPESKMAGEKGRNF